MKTINTHGWIWPAVLAAALLAPETAFHAQDDVEWMTTSRGVMMSLKVHLVDFGTVRDEGRLPPTLGQDAGRLSGPV